jgi:hypothetical protein
MKKLLLISTLFLASCTTSNLGKSGCKLTLSYFQDTDDLRGCVECKSDSLKNNATRTLKKIFPNYTIQNGVINLSK